MKHLFISLFSILLLACNSGQNSIARKAFTNQKTYLALGDSYTIGESVTESSRWPIQLVSKLKEDGYSETLTKIIAQTGWRTDDLIKAIQSENINATYDLVSLLIGVNNQYQNKSIELYRKEFRDLMEIVISKSKSGNKGVFVVSIPDYGVTPFARKMNPEKITSELNEYNIIAKEIAMEFGVVFIDITEISRQAAKDTELLANDKLHPSAKMYELWVEKHILPKVKLMLQ